MMKMATGDDFPSSGVPERDLEWFVVAIEAFVGETSDLGLSQGFFKYLTIYMAKRWCGRPPRWAQPTRARLGPQAHPGGLCPHEAPLWYFSGLSWGILSIKNHHKFLAILRIFISAPKTTFLLKTTSVRVSSNQFIPKSCKNIINMT